ncbi:helix-turn-helix domain-containing protein [Aquimarina sp. 2201CG14-23]|uniref:helix-turn-helix domain-containing protein n=1 Tax=Aquimarina mycalae TaxID=3040073 RepID=UPI002477FF05|nr:helix-turn-helix transcriptional regulator [Aquimarina sp. 2201CG14-23]MDH7444223.1 helix-turn-helix transcriptional regulator [Aquimarina sp. 2201CG14-23]
MDIQSQLLFFFSAFGAFNGIIVGLFFLFYVKPSHKSHIFLGLLLLALSVRIGKSVFFYFNDDLADIYIQIGLFACWFIGPLLYFYVGTALEVIDSIPKKLKTHFTILTPIALVLFLVFPRSSYEKTWVTLFIYFIYGQWAIYVIVSGLIVWKNFEKTKQTKKGVVTFRLWLLSIYLGNTIICLAFITGNYTSYIVGALSFSFVFYLLILLLLFAKKRNELIFLNPPRYREKRIDNDKAEQLIMNLEQLITEKEFYKNSDITLSKIAKKLNILPNKLSLLLNDNMKISFSDYLNGKRIEEAQKMIRSKVNYSFEAIGYDCGFNSKSAFYTAFKKHTGTTPLKYRKSITD